MTTSVYQTDFETFFSFKNPVMKQASQVIHSVYRTSKKLRAMRWLTTNNDLNAAVKRTLDEILKVVGSTSIQRPRSCLFRNSTKM